MLFTENKQGQEFRAWLNDSVTGRKKTCLPFHSIYGANMAGDYNIWLLSVNIKHCQLLSKNWVILYAVI